MSDAAQLAIRAAQLLAVDPAGLGGAVLRGPSGSGQDAWLSALRAGLAKHTPWRRMPAGIGEDRLLGGLDLAATLAAGRPVAAKGLLAEAAGGIVVVPSAERLGGSAAALLAGTLDTGEIVLERDGLAMRTPARLAAVLLDEGLDDEGVMPALGERVAFHIRFDVAAILPRATEQPPLVPGSASPLRNDGGLSQLGGGGSASVTIEDAQIEAICATALAFGVPSLRVATFAVRAAKAAAALAGRAAVGPDDIALAAALVIAPRATILPQAADEDPDDAEEPAPLEPEADDAESDQTDAEALTDQVVEATRAAVPPALLAELAAGATAGRRAPVGRAGAPHSNARRGRPAGTRPGLPGPGARLALVETLRAAAPWQRLRRQALSTAQPNNRILVRREDFRVARLKARSEAVTIFVVDASGSAAMHRLAEVKGAVELILAECYVRRDQVALIAFRGANAELILPPTRSLARAKRALAGQPGGGGTPLATAIEAASRLADGIRRKGQTALVVLMTDGRANIDRQGKPGRPAAEADAIEMARAFRLGGSAGLVLDIAPRPADAVRHLAGAMGARYVPLPYADAQTVSRAVMAAGSNK